MARLRLEVADFAGRSRWRWLLSEEVTGTPLADHEVDLAGEPGEFGAFTDLYRFVRWNTVPDRRAANEVLIVALAGGGAGPGDRGGYCRGGAGGGAGGGTNGGGVCAVVTAGAGACGQSVQYSMAIPDALTGKDQHSVGKWCRGNWIPAFRMPTDAADPEKRQLDSDIEKDRKGMPTP
jgi:hypothetical protein